ncbi:MAG TPA: hypothetical protein VFB63_21425 [Bryobacteraceae bacterium]|nr:hypothetical protein [Bryobacteraceae bacterium]
MRVDPEEIRRRFAALDDHDLAEVERSELSELAQQIYDEECARRDLPSELAKEIEVWEDESPAVMGAEAELDEDNRPEWLDDSACVCSFEVTPGTQSAIEVAKARAVLLTAGIPCYVSESEAEASADGKPPRQEVSLFVPGALNLHAVSVLDRDLFNAKHEEELSIHFKEISDDDLLALDPAVFTAGLLDRAARMKRVYASEMARRGLRR